MGTCENCSRPSSIYDLCENCRILKRNGDIHKCSCGKKWIEKTSQVCPDCQITNKQIELASNTSADDGLQIRGKYGIRTIMPRSEKLIPKFGQNLNVGLNKVKDIGKEASERLLRNMPGMEKAQKATKSIEETNDESENKFRNKYPKEFRTDDGHYVRSQGERTIDNWFYLNQIAHEYEKCLIKPDGKWMFPDFSLPYSMDGKYIGPMAKGIYVEYWGIENDKDYDIRKEQKMAFYKAVGFDIIPLTPADIKDINKFLKPKFAGIFKEKFS